MTAQAFLPFPGSTHEAGLYDQARARFIALRGHRSRRAFARELGLCYELLRRFELGADPGLDLLIVLGERGVRLDWLFFGDGPCTRAVPHRDDWQALSRLDFEPWETVSL